MVTAPKKYSPRKPSEQTAAERAVQQLRSNREQAIAAVTQMGHVKLLRLLKKAQLQLEARIPKINPKADFTLAAQRQVLAQLKLVTAQLKKGVGSVTREAAHDAAEKSARAMVRYVVEAEKVHTGMSMLGPRIQDAVQLNTAIAGADASVLRRVATDPGYRGSPAQAGVLDRYGIATVNAFEERMQMGLMSGATYGEVRAGLLADSSWLRDSPAYWAERIMRTETMAASNRAGHEVMRQVEQEVGETLRILVATFDSRTAADSYAVHGQVRRLEEPFDTWQGPCMVPPARPNDREVPVPHLKEWAIPPELMPRSDVEVEARWVEETRSKKHPNGRPGMPSRPVMSTVPGIGGVPG